MVVVMLIAGAARCMQDPSTPTPQTRGMIYIYAYPHHQMHDGPGDSPKQQLVDGGVEDADAQRVEAGRALERVNGAGREISIRSSNMTCATRACGFNR
jgi:hypothetical protein